MAAQTNLVLAGFMGTGKSTIGRLCARQLGFEFIDTDAEIEKREGLRIPQIFEARGEAYFRAREAALAQELVQREGLVIATGGGMIADDATRAALLASAVCVCLSATPDAIALRVGPDAAARRPMLRGGDVRERIAALLKEREPKYAQLHYRIDTTDLSLQNAAEAVTAIWRAEQARIPMLTPGNAGYDIVIGDGVLDQLGFMLAGRGWAPPFAIVSDSIVSSYFGGRAVLALKRAGLDAFIFTIRPGEASKSLANVEAMYRKFCERGMERGSPVIALGGGVVGDAAGFAAATYLRGVPFVQVPTTLLAMADSSIGGKVGVDTPFGKNLVGAFKQPDLVVIDTSTLFSLPIRELRCGMAEIVKSVLISGPEPYARLREWLRRAPLAQAEPFHSGEDGWVSGDMIGSLVDSMLMKRAVVQEDPFERGKRAWLNLGHTFGHGIEAWSQFQLKHGEAVSLGMVCAARLSARMGCCSPEFAEEIIETLRWVGLPVSMAEVYAFTDRLSFDVEAIWRIMQTDKKKRAGRLRFVLIREPGDVFVSDDVEPEAAKAALESLDH
jgi:3-dehydroquinate synthase